MVLALLGSDALSELVDLYVSVVWVVEVPSGAAFEGAGGGVVTTTVGGGATAIGAGGT
jgi:hypothetical protein